MNNRMWDGSAPAIVHPNSERRRRARVAARRAKGLQTIGDIPVELLRPLGARVSSTAFMLMLEAYTVSGGVANPAYVVMRALRLKGRREVLARDPKTHHTYRKTSVSYVFTNNERKLFDRSFARVFTPEVLAAIRREDRYARVMDDDFDPHVDPFGLQHWKESKNRADYLQLDCCDGSGWVYLQSTTEAVNNDGDDVYVTKRVRCEACARRAIEETRKTRKAEIFKRHATGVAHHAVTETAKLFNVQPAAILKSRGPRRRFLNTILAAIEDDFVSRPVIHDATGWKPYTATKSIQNGNKIILTLLGHKSSSAKSLPPMSSRGSAPTGLVGSSPAGPSLPSIEITGDQLTNAQILERLQSHLLDVFDDVMELKERFPADERVSNAVDSFLVETLGED